MKTLFAIYLIFFKGYSVIFFDDDDKEHEKSYKYGACNSKMEFDYDISGEWGTGNSPTEAIIDCYKKHKAEKKKNKQKIVYVESDRCKEVEDSLLTIDEYFFIKEALKNKTNGETFEDLVDKLHVFTVNSNNEN